MIKPLSILCLSVLLLSLSGVERWNLEWETKLGPFTLIMDQTFSLRDGDGDNARAIGAIRQQVSTVNKSLKPPYLIQTTWMIAKGTGQPEVSWQRKVVTNESGIVQEGKETFPDYGTPGFWVRHIPGKKSHIVDRRNGGLTVTPIEIPDGLLPSPIALGITHSLNRLDNINFHTIDAQSHKTHKAAASKIDDIWTITSTEWSGTCVYDDVTGALKNGFITVHTQGSDIQAHLFREKNWKHALKLMDNNSTQPVD